MVCKRFSFFSFVALFLSFSISCLFISGSAQAVSDISATYTSVPSEWSNVFPTCTSDCLNDYQYLIVEINSPIYDLTSIRSFFYIRFDGSYNNIFSISMSSLYSIYKLPFNGSPNNYLQFRNNLPSDLFTGGITFTLTDSLGGSSPSGSLSITENGTYDVSSYAEAVVNIPAEVVPGDYHNDIQEVKQAIILVPAVLLVVYFLWAIYKMIMGGVRR